MKIKIILIIVLLVFGLKLSAQLTSSQHQKINSLFIEWNEPNHPGSAIGNMQRDRIVYSRVFGLTSFEYLVPNSPLTLFNTGSVSKLFTAMGIVLLHLDGKLSFDDDIRKYISALSSGPVIPLSCRMENYWQITHVMEILN